MAKKPVVKTFDPKKDIMLITDEIEHLISGILSQEGHPIMYLSRRLTDIEFNYRERSIGHCVDNHLSPTIFNWKNSFEK